MIADLFNLRTARLDDAAAISAVLASAYSQIVIQSYDLAAMSVILPAVTIAKPQLLAGGTYYAQEVPGRRIVSCGGWTGDEPGTNKVEDGVAHIRHFGTHVDWTRKGLGSGIFERCKQEARAAGIHTLKCFSSLGAEPFYAALGFHAVERTEIIISETVKIPSVAMVWTHR